MHPVGVMAEHSLRNSVHSMRTRFQIRSILLVATLVLASLIVGVEMRTESDSQGPNLTLAQISALREVNGRAELTWALTIGGSSAESANSVVIDSANDAYIAGNFRSNNLAFGSQQLSPAGQMDFFVAKLDSTGTWDWAVSVGGMLQDSVSGIALNYAEDELHITGQFDSQQITFGSHTLTDNSGVFVATLKTDDGQWKWASSLIGSNADQVHSITSDSSGDIYVGGFVSGSNLSCDYSGGVNYYDNEQGGNDGYVAKFDDSGYCEWVSFIAGTADDRVNAIAYNSVENTIAVTGQFSSPLLKMIDSSGLNQMEVSGSSGGDAFVLFLDPVFGDIDDCMAAMTGDGPQVGLAIGNDDNGDTYVAGRFAVEVDYGSSTMLNSEGMDDGFLVKYDNLCNQKWGVSAGGPDDDSANSIAVTSTHVIVSGTFGDDITIGSETLMHQGGDDIFAARVKHGGMIDGTASWGSTGDEMAHDLALDDRGKPCLVGEFTSSQLTFGQTTLSKNSGTSADADIFAACAPFGNGGAGNNNPSLSIGVNLTDFDDLIDVEIDLRGLSQTTSYTLEINWTYSGLEISNSSYSITNAMDPTFRYFELNLTGIREVGPYCLIAKLHGPGLSIQDNDCLISTYASGGDRDGDADSADAFPDEPTQWADFDGDGYGDNQSGIDPDDCPNDFGVSWDDRLGCADADVDGVSDLNDNCANTSIGVAIVDAFGCEIGEGPSNNTTQTTDNNTSSVESSKQAEEGQPPDDLFGKIMAHPFVQKAVSFFESPQGQVASAAVAVIGFIIRMILARSERAKNKRVKKFEKKINKASRKNHLESLVDDINRVNDKGKFPRGGYGDLMEQIEKRMEQLGFASKVSGDDLVNQALEGINAARDELSSAAEDARKAAEEAKRASLRSGGDARGGRGTSEVAAPPYGGGGARPMQTSGPGPMRPSQNPMDLDGDGMVSEEEKQLFKNLSSEDLRTLRAEKKRERDAEQAAKAATNKPTVRKPPAPNDDCHCGSGKKYRKCHMKKDEKEAKKAAKKNR